MSTIQADFDRIAAMSQGEGWDHNNHYHDYLLKQLPSQIERALDIGCGTGAFSRRLAERSDEVLGLDLSPEMIRVAQERSKGCGNIHYQAADVMAYDLPENHFDGIASIATMHHLPFEVILLKLRDALKSGGVLLILDLFEEEFTPSSLVYNALAFPVSHGLKLLKNGRTQDSPQVRAAWEAHSQHDTFMTLSQIRKTSSHLLPGSQVRRHLLWRYSLMWRKP